MRCSSGRSIAERIALCIRSGVVPRPAAMRGSAVSKLPTTGMRCSRTALNFKTGPPSASASRPRPQFEIDGFGDGRQLAGVVEAREKRAHRLRRDSRFGGHCVLRMSASGADMSLSGRIQLRMHRPGPAAYPRSYRRLPILAPASVRNKVIGKIETWIAGRS